jgi:hypothetical protein
VHIEFGLWFGFEQKLFVCPCKRRRHVHRGISLPDTIEHVEDIRHSGEQRGWIHWHNVESSV